MKNFHKSLEISRLVPSPTSILLPSVHSSTLASSNSSIHTTLSPGAPPIHHMKMVMLLKPGKDHTWVKGWHPIVLANTMGKLAEMLSAQESQAREELWHERAFAGRKGRGAIDTVMLMKMIMEKQPEGEATSRDAQPASNTLRRYHMAAILRGQG